jgi:two-component system chemotaxis response regulator CheY
VEQSEVKILIVDDVQAMRTQAVELLGKVGFINCHTAASAQEAQKLLTESIFQLILCDWHMENGDGLGLLQFVRTQHIDTSCPFIMVTAESTKELVLEALKAGVDDYVLKPLTQAHINKIYRLLLQKKVL